MSGMKAAWLGCLLTGSLAAAAPVQTPETPDLVIHAGRLFDGVASVPRDKVSILIKGERIVELQSGFVRPPNVAVIDLSGGVVLPGLIDVHIHVTSGGPPNSVLYRGAEDRAFQAAANMRAILNAGFTGVRDLGGNTEVLRALKQAISTNLIPGPRLWYAGNEIGPTGGPSDPSNGIDPRWTRTDDWKATVIDGPQEAIKAVRELRKRGADVIKIYASGAVLSIGDDPNLQVLRDDEMQAIVTTAHALGMKVASHAHSKAGIEAAVAAGVDSIEHGTYADAATYKLMIQRNTFLVPTLFAGREVQEVAISSPDKLPPGVAAKAIALVPSMAANALRAYRAGVKIALGTDQLGFRPHGQNAKELEYLVAAGIPPAEVLFAATRNAAELLGQSAHVGSIQAGRYADLIAVDSNPFEHIEVLQRVQFVMKGGRVYKTQGQPVAFE